MSIFDHVHSPFAASLRPTFPSGLQPPPNGLSQCLRFGQWLTLYTLKKFIDLLRILAVPSRQFSLIIINWLYDSAQASRLRTCNTNWSNQIEVWTEKVISPFGLDLCLYSVQLEVEIWLHYVARSNDDEVYMSQEHQAICMSLLLSVLQKPVVLTSSDEMTVYKVSVDLQKHHSSIVSVKWIRSPIWQLLLNFFRHLLFFATWACLTSCISK